MPKSNADRVRSLVTEEAADWFVANRAGLTAQERQAFAAWLKSSPLHVEEYLGIAATARDLHPACAYPEDSIDALIEQARNENDSVIQPL